MDLIRSPTLTATTWATQRRWRSLQQRAHLERRRHGPDPGRAGHGPGNAVAALQQERHGGTVRAAGPKITAVHAEHSSELVWKNPATNKDEVHYGGEPVGYIIEMENGFKVWHMGDTGRHGDMRMIGEMIKPTSC